MSITLLRHGETLLPGFYCGSTDVGLSDAGWQAMHEAVKGRRWSRIISSPLRRCARFAHAFSMSLDLECEIDERWRELHFGVWEGRHGANIPDAELAAFWRDPVAMAPAQGEALSDMQARVNTARADLLASGVDTLVITHGGPIRVLLAQARGETLRDSLKIEVPHARLIDLPRA